MFSSQVASNDFLMCSFSVFTLPGMIQFIIRNKANDQISGKQNKLCSFSFIQAKCV